MGKVIKIVIADDHPVFFRGLRMLLESESPDVSVIAASINGAEMLEILEQQEADVAIVDAHMPKLDGSSTIQCIRDKYPSMKTIILTTFGDPSTIRSCLAAGADGLLLKDAQVGEIIDAIHRVMEGHRYISEPALQTLYESDKESSDFNESQSIIESLSIRQQEVLHLIAQGKRNNEIAKILFISERTVRNYVSIIYDIIGVGARGEAIIWARKHGID